MREEWRELRGHRETYLVSDKGMVKTKDRIGTRNNPVQGRELRQRDNSNGYLRVNVRLLGDKKSKYYLVHRLVAKAFIPEVEGKPHINHIDGNKHNNTVSNLERCSKSENERHARCIGLKKPPNVKGESHGGRKFNWDDIISIREEYIKGDRNHGQCALGRKYGTSQSHIQQIVSGKIWE